MEFIGKWILAGFDGSILAVDFESGVLGFTRDANAAGRKFNAYGRQDKFMLQAANGRYVTYKKKSYQACEDRDSNAVYTFGLESAGTGIWYMADHGAMGGGRPGLYWNASGLKLVQMEKTSSLPDTARFKQTVVTVGFADFKERGFPVPKPDLSWVSLAGADLDGVNFTQANLSNADLSNANMSGLPFQRAILDSADLSGAKLTDMADFTGASLNKTCLVNAAMINVILTQADLSGANCSGAEMTGNNMTGTVCHKGIFNRTIFKNGFIINADFSGATLTEADFTAAVVRGIDLTDANLSGASIGNTDPKHITIDLSDAKLNRNTNFSRARATYVDLRGQNMEHIDMAHADFTGAKLDNVKLNHAELSYVILNKASLTGSIPMHGANLSNATLEAVDLTGAQMGSISLLFRITEAGSCRKFNIALDTGDIATVKSVFEKNGTPLTEPVVVSSSAYAKGRVWEVRTEHTTYTVRLETAGTGETMAVYETVTAAILNNAFMKDAVLTSANLYNVRASGIQLYGQAKLDGNAILERAQFNNANMSNIDLKLGKLYGVNLDHAVLINAKFQGCSLCQDAGGGQSSLGRANLQGANFSDADLNEAIFTDAAVSVARTPESAGVDGVWLFELAGNPDFLSELAAATTLYTLDPSLASDLKQGAVSESVQKAFKTQGIPLEAEALVSVQATGPIWEIIDGSKRFVIYRDCNRKTYQPALGVGTAVGKAPLFTMSLKLESCLKNGPVAQAVRTVFKDHGVDLTSSATVVSSRQNTDWEIVDSKTSYMLWLGLDPYEYEWQVYVRSAIPTLIEGFSTHSVPLTRRVTVRSDGEDCWKIDNDSENPYNATTNYIRFNCVRNSADPCLEIYGYAMRVQRMESASQLAYHNVNCELTLLPEDKMSASTVCPNSLRGEVNKSEHTPYKKWMRAKELPKAPICVPDKDGHFICP